MKKLVLVSLLTILIISVTNIKTYSSEPDQNYNTVSISNDYVKIKEYIISSQFGNKFIVGEKLSEYFVLLDFYYDTFPRASQIKWKDPNYLIQEGYQEATLILDVPDYAEITIGFTGEPNPTNVEPTPTPKVLNPEPDAPKTEDQELSPTLAKSSVSLQSETKYKIKVVDLPDGYTYSFTSSNKEVATVGAKTGVVKGIAKGKTVVKCIITTPDNQKITLKCVIIVK